MRAAMSAAGWEPTQLWELRTELQANPALCERALAVVREPVPEPKRALIRTDSESVDLALARALALAVNGAACRVELIQDDGNSS
jgi:hypothetical protein